VGAFINALLITQPETRPVSDSSLTPASPG
jgi:hypothetical protein